MTIKLVTDEFLVETNSLQSQVIFFLYFQIAQSEAPFKNTKRLQRLKTPPTIPDSEKMKIQLIYELEYYLQKVKELKVEIDDWISDKITEIKNSLDYVEQLLLYIKRKK